ncbi:MAG: site-specific DNA-methyltransferase [Acidaminococcus sp.]|nr:site-specific DNA-methyltransferase [Acidaminococcus sp.]MCI2100723.1 site-specific DNA-methyltransferase [Acidaminococcus sp.]MCI2115044.1 site-specific DNA-methyltransferase [Acidaminococcus sp.]MCI2117120.1 site-specific DNA-methyltransferase [Acidaminococcus sp.]
MDKLKMHTPDLAEKNYQKLVDLFPNAVTETIDENGNVIRAIDKDVLMQEINTQVVDGNQERYRFTWPDKRNAIILANQPIAKTLRLNREKSVGKDGTSGGIDSENIYIEGDNLDALKLLRETYLGKVKMIYIDPPYNTGNDFIYEDDFSQKAADYLDKSGQIDNQGNRLVQNFESNGRFHTAWLNMLYPRIRIAKDLMSDDGAIFISIGQSELDNMLKICDEIFGRPNRAGVVSRQMKTGNNQGKFFTQNIDYIVVYAKNAEIAKPFKADMSQELIEKVYNKVQETGPRKGERYRTMGFFQASLKHGGSSYPIECPDGEKVITPNGLPWRWNQKTFEQGLKNDDIVFVKSSSTPLLDYVTGTQAHWNIYTKIWLNSRLEAGQLPSDLILKYENRHAAKELNSLKIPFDFPKPVELMKYLIHIINDNSFYVMDFFSGSATTAQAVFQQNAEDKGKRKFILVQLPEITDAKSAAYQAGYKTICDIGEERIRRAGKKIKEETGADIDYGFRCFKVDSSNMKDVYYQPDAIKQDQIGLFENNIKEDRTPEDLLIQVMLDLGILLSSKIEEVVIGGKKVFSVDDGYLLACFDKNVTDETVTEIAKRHPFYAVFRDRSMENDSVLTNFEQIFATYSPETVRKVI